MGIKRCRLRIYTLCRSQRRFCHYILILTFVLCKTCMYPVFFFSPWNYGCVIAASVVFKCCDFCGAEPLLQVIHINYFHTWTLSMTSNIVSCLCWVPRGASKEKPDKVRENPRGRGAYKQEEQPHTCMYTCESVLCVCKHVCFFYQR